MQTPVQFIDDGHCEVVHALLEDELMRGDFSVPRLPDVAVRVVAARESTNAQQLSDIVKADRALSSYILRIAASAPNRPATPIVSLPHAVAWLGFDEVANTAFTLALQAKMLDVPGRQRKARQLWRHSLACALWSRQLAVLLAANTGLCYLCGLLHDIGKVVTLGLANDLARRSSTPLSGDDYARLIEAFHRAVAARVVTAWGLPAPILGVVTRWENYADAGLSRRECNIVNAAHRLADCTEIEGRLPARDLFTVDASFRDLGLSSQESLPLFDSSPQIDTEIDRYLAP
jgi:HD-like signal output (HDOD) protein